MKNKKRLAEAIDRQKRFLNYHQEYRAGEVIRAFKNRSYTHIRFLYQDVKLLLPEFEDIFAWYISSEMESGRRADNERMRQVGPEEAAQVALHEAYIEETKDDFIFIIGGLQQVIREIETRGRI